MEKYHIYKISNEHQLAAHISYILYKNSQLHRNNSYTQENRINQQNISNDTTAESNRICIKYLS